MRSKLVTPGLAASSARMLPSVSVTARAIFRRIASGSSSTSMMPATDEDDLLILAVGSCRSVIFATSRMMYAAGTVNVSPYRWLNRMARSRLSSRCCRWSSPTGTWSVWYSRMSAACSTG